MRPEGVIRTVRSRKSTDGEVEEVDATTWIHDFPVQTFVWGTVFFHIFGKRFEVLLRVVEDHKGVVDEAAVEKDPVHWK